jgi:hypothetical protein
MRMPVYARDPASDTTISVFELDKHRITPFGQELTIRIRESIAESSYPDGTLVMLWEDEPTSASDRSHVKFIGWHQADPASIDAKRTGLLKDTTLECVDVAGRLSLLPGFSQSIALAASPVKWTQMTAPNMDKYLHYLLHWHSNVFDLADWTNSGTGTDFPFMLLDSDGDSLFEQVNDRARALVPDRVLTCNTLGQLATIVDPLLQDTGDRTATSQATLNEDDYTKLDYTHRRTPRYHWLRGDAILASGTAIAALFCIAPGTAPSQGVDEYTSNRQLAKSQSDLNACEGHRYARINAPEEFFKLTLAEGNDLDLEPAELTWVTINITSNAATQRGLTLTSERFLMREIDIDYQHSRTGLTRTVKLTLERETDGYPAQTYEIPEGDIPDPEWDPPPQPDYDDDPGETTGDGFGTAYIFLGTKLVETSNLGSTSPTWTDITGTITGTNKDFILDPWNPTSRAFALTTTGVWRITDLDSSPAYELVLANADVALSGKSLNRIELKIQASINLEDYLVCFARYTNGDSDWFIHCWYSLDAGDTWNESLVKAVQPIGGAACRMGGAFDVVPHTINDSLVLYCALYVQSNLSYTYQIYKSVNAGASWAQAKSVALGGGGVWHLPACLNTPYLGNEDGNEVWVSFLNDTAVRRYIWKSTDGFSTYDTIALPGTTNDYTKIKRLGIEIYVPNNNNVAIWNAENKFFKSVDGENFTEVAFSGYDPVVHGNVAGAGGFPSINGRYYIVTDTRYVFSSSNGGSSWTERTGNLRSVITSDDDAADYIEKGVIVPVWVAE